MGAKFIYTFRVDGLDGTAREFIKTFDHELTDERIQDELRLAMKRHGYALRSYVKSKERVGG